MSDQCSGPFTDARDCPMHAKDVPVPIYTQAQLDAEVERAVASERTRCADLATSDYAHIRELEVKPLREAVSLLPLEDFDRDMDTVDAAEFVDHAGQFWKAMNAIRKALAASALGRERT